MTRLLLSILLFASWCDAASLRAHVNIVGSNVQGHRDKPERFVHDDLFTDVTVPANTPNAYEEWRAALGAIKQNAPLATVGTYISSRHARTREQLIHFPAECPLLRHFTPAEYMPDRFHPTSETGKAIDYRQPVARAKLIRVITSEAVFRGLPVCFTDNWVWNDGLIPPSVTLDYMTELRKSLNVRAIKMYCNVAIGFGGVIGDGAGGLKASIPDAEIQRLAEAADGITLEQVIVPAAGKDETYLKRAVREITMILTHGTKLVFIPLGVDRPEARFYAGLAMVLQQKGNVPLVAWPVFEDNEPWSLWRDQFGEPAGELELVKNKISRRFERGTIFVDCAARTVEVR